MDSSSGGPDGVADLDQVDPRDLFLELTVTGQGPDATLLPRQRLQPAFHAATAETVFDAAVTTVKLLDDSVTDAKLAPDAVYTDALQADVITAEKISDATLTSLAPAGAVVAFAGVAVPPGWLLCDGAAIDRALNPELSAAMFNSSNGSFPHGDGDGSTTFNLPDYRGRFLRGTNRSSGRDPDVGDRTAMAPGGSEDDNVGSVQGDEFESHHHRQTGFTSGANPAGCLNLNARDGCAEPPSVSTNSFTEPFGGAGETRPINAYVDFIIKCGPTDACS